MNEVRLQTHLLSLLLLTFAEKGLYGKTFHVLHRLEFSKNRLTKKFLVTRDSDGTGF